MFDTHAHLNFKSFDGIVDEVIAQAKKAGVTHMTVPGTDIASSKRAIAIAEKNDNVYAAVGIHPHHVFQYVTQNKTHVTQEIKKLAELLDSCVSSYKLHDSCPIVALGEIGLDRHIYKKTKYENYQVDELFIEAQKELFVAQLELAKKYQKSVIIHNREAKKDTLSILSKHWNSFFAGRMVLHCCEPDAELLEFAKSHHIYIGVDGDVTYQADKQAFIKTIPLEMLVLETDAPFLSPEPFKSQKVFPNKPANLKIIAEFVAKLYGISSEKIEKQTAENAKKLFRLK